MTYTQPYCTYFDDGPDFSNSKRSERSLSERSDIARLLVDIHSSKQDIGNIIEKFESVFSEDERKCVGSLVDDLCNEHNFFVMIDKEARDRNVSLPTPTKKSNSFFEKSIDYFEKGIDYLGNVLRKFYGVERPESYYSDFNYNLVRAAVYKHFMDNKNFIIPQGDN